MLETLKFSFKGDRSYVHGTSIFDAIVHAASQRGVTNGKINIFFKKKVYNPICVLEERTPTPKDSIYAEIDGYHGKSIILCINESSDTSEAGRQEYNEQEICQGAILEGNSITQNDIHHSNSIELLVALCKTLHQNLYGTSKKWVFSRYEGQFPVPKINKAELKIVKKLGARLTCSEVKVNDQTIGHIYFS